MLKRRNYYNSEDAQTNKALTLPALASHTPDIAGQSESEEA